MNKPQRSAFGGRQLVKKWHLGSWDDIKITDTELTTLTADLDNWHLEIDTGEEEDGYDSMRAYTVVELITHTAFDQKAYEAALIAYDAAIRQQEIDRTIAEIQRHENHLQRLREVLVWQNNQGPKQDQGTS